MDDTQVKNAVAAAVRDFLMSDKFIDEVWETLEVENNLAYIEAGPLSPLQTTIRVKYEQDRPATFLTVQVKSNI